MTNDDLAKDIPDIAASLATIMVRDALGGLTAVGVEWAEMSPAVSLIVSPKDGSPDIKVTLSIALADAEEDDGSEWDDEEEY